jgi:hypothetical protein
MDEPPITVMDVDRNLAFPAGAGQTENFAGVCRLNASARAQFKAASSTPTGNLMVFLKSPASRGGSPPVTGEPEFKIAGIRYNRARPDSSQSHEMNL